MKSELSASWLREQAKLFDTQNWKPCFIAHEALQPEIDSNNPLPQKVSRLRFMSQCPVQTIEGRPFCAHFEESFPDSNDPILVRMRTLEQEGIIDYFTIGQLSMQRLILSNLDVRFREIRIAIQILSLKIEGHDVTAIENRVSKAKTLKIEDLLAQKSTFNIRYMEAFNTMKALLTSVHTRMLEVAEIMEPTVVESFPSPQLLQPATA